MDFRQNVMKLGSKETEKIKRKLASLNGRFSVPDGNFTLADHRQLIVFQNSRLEAVDCVLPAPGSFPKIQPLNKFRNA